MRPSYVALAAALAFLAAVVVLERERPRGPSVAISDTNGDSGRVLTTESGAVITNP